MLANTEHALPMMKAHVHPAQSIDNADTKYLEGKRRGSASRGARRMWE
jgi:hypothetical protein